MFAFQARNRQNAAASPRAPTSPLSPTTATVGEIDTAAPFESVRAAVTLFKDQASPKTEKPIIKKTKALEESVLGKEAQLHWILKEIDRLKEYVKTAESTKEKALQELEKANKTLVELTNKLEEASESRHASIQAAEAAHARAHELEELKSTKTQASDEASWQETVDKERNEYRAAANQLIATKQELNSLKQDFDVALEAKLVAVQRAAEALHAKQVNRKKINQLSKDVVELSVTLDRVKFASAKADEEYAKLMEEKEIQLESKKKAKEETGLKIKSLKTEVKDPVNIEKRLEETTGAISVIEEQLKEVRAADIELLDNANSELDEAKRRLEGMKGEETSLRDVVESLKQEVENVKRDISISKEEGLKIEQLQVELDKIEVEMKEAKTEETKVTSEVDEIEKKIHEMLLEAEKARKEEEEMKKQVEKLWKDAQWSEVEINDVESKLEAAKREFEEAKTAEEIANDQIRKRSSKEEVIDSNSDNMIMLSTKEFAALSKVAEEALIEADEKVGDIMAEVETIKENERGILEKLEKSMEEQKNIEEEISKAEKTAEVADAARQTVESELNKWREETKGS